MPRKPLRRLGLILTAIFQLVLPTFVSVADVRAEAASQRAVTHIEAHGTSRCVQVHADDCALCRVLTGGAAPSRGAPALVAATRVLNASVPPYDLVVTGAPAAGDPSQRAPPSV
ncbi:MAG TPA: hypothetical protein VF461_01540 [Gemmatimonadaceae bacterium]